MPVSYTHLDVYKRQLQSKIQLGGQPHRAQDAQGILGKTFFRIAHAAHQACPLYTS